MFSWTTATKPVIGMLHVPALPGSPCFSGTWSDLVTHVLRDAEALSQGGVHALLLENFGDVPFYPDRVPPHTVAQVTALAMQVSRASSLPLGINVLRNDGRAALAVAQAVGARFIRVNVWCGARVTDQGVIAGIAHDVLRDRLLLQATGVQIWADVDVKHSAPLGPRPLVEEVADVVERGRADGIIVSGTATGQPVDLTKLQIVRQATHRTPVLLGSGVTADALASYWPHADGFIVGTAFKPPGQVHAPVDRSRVTQLMTRHAELSLPE